MADEDFISLIEQEVSAIEEAHQKSLTKLFGEKEELAKMIAAEGDADTKRKKQLQKELHQKDLEYQIEEGFGSDDLHD